MTRETHSHLKLCHLRELKAIQGKVKAAPLDNSKQGQKSAFPKYFRKVHRSVSKTFMQKNIYLPASVSGSAHHQFLCNTKTKASPYT